MAHSKLTRRCALIGLGGVVLGRGFLAASAAIETTSDKQTIIYNSDLADSVEVTYYWGTNEKISQFSIDKTTLDEYSKYHVRTIPSVFHNSKSKVEFLEQVNRVIIESSRKYTKKYVPPQKSVVEFVQSIPYSNDYSRKYLLPDHAAFVEETLAVGHGDCEDTSIVLASLLSAPPFNFDPLLVFPPKHCAVVIPVSQLWGRELDGTEPLFRYRDKDYAYIETTSPEEIGKIPSQHMNTPRDVLATDGENYFGDWKKTVELWATHYD